MRLGAPVVTAAAAWTVLLAAEASPLSRYLSHDVLGRASLPLPVAVAGHAAGWIAMVAAMMLPVSMALRSPGAWPGGAWLGGYLGVWLGAGFVFAWVDLALHGLVGVLDAGAAAFPAVLAAVCGSAWSVHAVLRDERVRGSGPGASVASVSVLPFRTPRAPTRTAPILAGRGWLDGLHCLRTCGGVMLALQALAPGDLGVMAVAGAGLAVLRLHTRSRARSARVLRLGRGVARERDAHAGTDRGGQLQVGTVGGGYRPDDA